MLKDGVWELRNCAWQMRVRNGGSRKWPQNGQRKKDMSMSVTQRGLMKGVKSLKPSRKWRAEKQYRLLSDTIG